MWKVRVGKAPWSGTYFPYFLDFLQYLQNSTPLLSSQRDGPPDNVTTTVNAGFIVSVHSHDIMENRPVDPDNIQGGHRPICFT